jgi:hypothetical protein
VIVGLTRQFRDTAKARAATDTAFREALFQVAVSALLADDLDAGKTTLRDYINATVSFERLGAATKPSPKSLMRMFGLAGNPQAKNLFAVLAKLQKATGVRLEVKAA